MDWLKCQTEGHQMFSSYKEGKGNIKWIKPNKNKINLFIMDDTFTSADIEKYKDYAVAFFPGACLGVIKRTDFLKKANVANRIGVMGN